MQKFEGFVSFINTQTEMAGGVFQSSISGPAAIGNIASGDKPNNLSFDNSLVARTSPETTPAWIAAQICITY
jgi:hypothetical protein